MLVNIRMKSKSIKKIFRYSLILLVSFCFSSCSWGILLVVGNNLDRDIKITYKINETKFLKTPKTFSFGEKLFYFYKRNEEKRPIELTNNAEYNSGLSIVTLTIKSGEAAFIGDYASYESFEEELTKSELKIIIDKDSILEKEKLIELSKYKSKIRLVEIK